MEDGAEVEAGAPLVVLEAMKMEHAVRGSRAGFGKSGVVNVHARPAESAPPCAALHERSGSGLSIYEILGTACAAPCLQAIVWCLHQGGFKASDATNHY